MGLGIETDKRRLGTDNRLGMETDNNRRIGTDRLGMETDNRIRTDNGIRNRNS